MNPVRHATAAVLAAACLDAAAATVAPSLGSDYSDLWWNPLESGWGMNVVQQGEVAFVTLFVYGPDGKPTWYVASDARAFALDSAGNPAFRGTLYKTTGPWLGGPFDPSQVTVQAVGQLVIEPRAEARLNVNYTAEGVSVSKDVVRQTFEIPSLGATHHGSFRLRQAVPGQAPWGTRDYTGDVMVHVEAGQAYLRVEDGGGKCEYRGAHGQSGRFGRIAGEYECADGARGTFEVTDFEVTRQGITGYMRMWSPTLNQHGRFAAARY